MVDYSKYKFNGWGLSKKALTCIEHLIKQHNLKSAIEFGSGQSTQFLHDIGIEYVSFEDDPKYLSSLPYIKIRELVQFTDIEFDKLCRGFETYFDICLNKPLIKERNTKQKNCFYKILPQDINGKFDLMILDGPNGNGRSLAFNIVKPYLNSNAFILIDDYNHYPFITYLLICWPKAKLIYSHAENNDNFQIWQI